MNNKLIAEADAATGAGTKSFPEIVGMLIEAGVEYYHVDYAGRRKTYYGPSGEPVTSALDYESLPTIAEGFDLPALRANILDSQRNNQNHRDFTRRAMAAGVQGYFAFLRGKRVTYFGRQGDQHVEWFPGADPAKAKT